MRGAKRRGNLKCVSPEIERISIKTNLKTALFDLVSKNQKTWFVAVSSGALMASSFVPWNLSILAWIAWIPLLSQLLPTDPSKTYPIPFRLGFGTGFVFWLCTIYWIGHVTIFGMIGLAAYLSLYFGLWAVWVAILRTQWFESKGWLHVFTAFFGACGWVVLEWIRGWMLGGFPWNFAGVSQHQNLVLIQIVEWTGAFGISFVIIFFNISLWLTWRRLRLENFSMKSWRYEFSAAIFLVVVCFFIGMKHILKYRTQNQTTVLKVALVQPDIPQDIKYEPLSRKDQLERLQQLTLMAAATQPQLILWPETAVVDGPSFDAFTRYWLTELVQQTKIPILFGTLDASIKGTGQNERRKYYNAAVLLKSDGVFVSAYRKIHLVPFGEYIPWEKWIPWLRFLTPIQASMESGGKPVLFDFQNFRWGTVICFEDTFSYLTRDLAQNEADVLVNLTNDAWFKTSPGAAMHAANAVFRSIETRRPLIRCANHGITQIISPNGNVASQLKPFRDGFLSASVTISSQKFQTFYTRHGDWFAYTCLGFAFMGLIPSIWKIRQNAPKMD